MEENALEIHSAEEFREWLFAHHDNKKECWLSLKRGKPKDDGSFYYLDAVEVALCFGWIDSVQKSVDGQTLQRFSPRQKGSPWSELNKERVRRLEKLGLMTKWGKAVLPPMGPRSFQIDIDVEAALKKARVFKTFKSFPPLYQRVRAYNLMFYKKVDPRIYEKSLQHLIEETKKEKMFGEWNDYGRLLNY